MRNDTSYEDEIEDDNDRSLDESKLVEFDENEEIDELIYTSSGLKKTGRKIKCDAVGEDVYLRAISGDMNVCKDPEAEEILVRQWLGLVHLIANRTYLSFQAKYQNLASVTLEDAESYAMEGLVRAIRTYNPEKSKFITFAYVCISTRSARAFLRLKNSARKQDVLDNLQTRSMGEANNEDDERALEYFLPDKSEDFYIAKETSAAQKLYKLIALAGRGAALRYMLERTVNPDVTFGAVAEKMGVSRQHVQDAYNRTCKQLRTMDENARCVNLDIANGLTIFQTSKKWGMTENQVDYYLDVYRFIYENGRFPLGARRFARYETSVYAELAEDALVKEYLQDQATETSTSKDWLRKKKKGVSFQDSVQFTKVINEEISNVNVKLYLGEKMSLWRESGKTLGEISEVFRFSKDEVEEFLELDRKYRSKKVTTWKQSKSEDEAIEEATEAEHFVLGENDEKIVERFREHLDKIDIKKFYQAVAKIFPNDYRLQALAKMSESGLHHGQLGEIMGEFGYSDKSQFAQDMVDARAFADEIFAKAKDGLKDEQSMARNGKNLTAQYLNIARLLVGPTPKIKPNRLIEICIMGNKIARARLMPVCEAREFVLNSKDWSMENFYTEFGITASHKCKLLYLELKPTVAKTLTQVEMAHKASKSQEAKDIALALNITESEVERYLNLFDVIHYDRPLVEIKDKKDERALRLLHFIDSHSANLYKAVQIDNISLRRLSKDLGVPYIWVSKGYQASERRLNAFVKKLDMAAAILANPGPNTKYVHLRKNRFYWNLKVLLEKENAILLDTLVSDAEIVEGTREFYQDDTEFIMFKKRTAEGLSDKQLAEEFGGTDNTAAARRLVIRKRIERDLEQAERMFYLKQEGHSQEDIMQVLQINQEEYRKIETILKKTFKRVYRLTADGVEELDINLKLVRPSKKLSAQRITANDFLREGSVEVDAREDEFAEDEMTSEENLSNAEEVEPETVVHVSNEYILPEVEVVDGATSEVEDAVVPESEEQGVEMALAGQELKGDEPSPTQPAELEENTILVQEEKELEEIVVVGEDAQEQQGEAEKMENIEILEEATTHPDASLGYASLLEKDMLLKLCGLFTHSPDVINLQEVILGANPGQLAEACGISDKELKLSLLRGEDELVEMLQSLKKWVVAGEASEVRVKNGEFYEALSNYLLGAGEKPKENPFEFKKWIDGLISCGVPRNRFKTLIESQINGKSVAEIKHITGKTRKEITRQIEAEKSYLVDLIERVHGNNVLKESSISEMQSPQAEVPKKEKQLPLEKKRPGRPRKEQKEKPRAKEEAPKREKRKKTEAEKTEKQSVSRRENFDWVSLDIPEIITRIAELFPANMQVQAIKNAKINGTSYKEELMILGGSDRLATNSQENANTYLINFLKTMLDVKKTQRKEKVPLSISAIAKELNLPKRQVSYFLDAFDYVVKGKEKPLDNPIEKARIVELLANDLSNPHAFQTLCDIYLDGLSQRDISAQRGVHLVTISNRYTSETEILNDLMVNSLKAGRNIVEKKGAGEFKDEDFKKYARIYGKICLQVEQRDEVLEKIREYAKDNEIVSGDAVVSALLKGKSIVDIARKSSRTTKEIKEGVYKLLAGVEKSAKVKPKKTQEESQEQKIVQQAPTQKASSVQLKKTDKKTQAFDTWADYRLQVKAKVKEFMTPYLKKSATLRRYFSGVDIEELATFMGVKSSDAALNNVIYLSTIQINEYRRRPNVKRTAPSSLDVFVAVVPFDKHLYYDVLSSFLRFHELPQNAYSMLIKSVDMAIENCGEATRKTIEAKYLVKEFRGNLEYDYCEMLNGQDEEITALYPEIQANFSRFLNTTLRKKEQKEIEK